MTAIAKTVAATTVTGTTVARAPAHAMADAFIPAPAAADLSPAFAPTDPPPAPMTPESAYPAQDDRLVISQSAYATHQYGVARQHADAGNVQGVTDALALMNHALEPAQRPDCRALWLNTAHRLAQRAGQNARSGRLDVCADDLDKAREVACSVGHNPEDGALRKQLLGEAEARQREVEAANREKLATSALKDLARLKQEVTKGTLWPRPSHVWARIQALENAYPVSAASNAEMRLICEIAVRAELRQPTYDSFLWCAQSDIEAVEKMAARCGLTVPREYYAGHVKHELGRAAGDNWYASRKWDVTKLAKKAGMDVSAAVSRLDREEVKWNRQAKRRLRLRQFKWVVTLGWLRSKTY